MSVTDVMEAEAPVVLALGSDEFRSHLGAAWREVADGAVLRVTDRRSGQVLGWITREPPAELAAHVAKLPAEASDQLHGDDEPAVLPAQDPDWTVREDGLDPAPEAA